MQYEVITGSICRAGHLPERRVGGTTGGLRLHNDWSARLVPSVVSLTVVRLGGAGGQHGGLPQLGRRDSGVD
jgi:hypothetical protein